MFYNVIGYLLENEKPHTAESMFHRVGLFVCYALLKGLIFNYFLMNFMPLQVQLSFIS